ncbi:ROK family transcriptional regulator [Glutamicibacter endophyticus]|uniref:ROK family transcriptional regulator n=1 Tax=Glutamicibacter endophyticus TaxID=1522174 RepID=UPI003AF18FA1
MPESTQLGKPGSQSALRHRNARRVLLALASGPRTQAMLTRDTGLSAGTVSNIVKNLITQGRAHTEPTISSGRKALNIVLNGPGALGLGIDFGRRGLRMIVVASGNTIVAERTSDLPASSGAEACIARAAELLTQMVDSGEISRGSVLEAAVSLPSPIDHRTGTLASSSILPQWAGVDIAAAVGQALQVPTVIDNDANLAALAEATWSEHATSEQLFYLKIDRGIGAGLLLNGQIHYGHIGITGEIGHAAMQDDGLPCRCGNRGCLETQASTDRMLDRLQHTIDPPRSVAELVEYALDGHPPTLRVLEDAGLAAGRTLGFISSLLNPEVIVVGGPLGELLLDPVRRGHQRYTSETLFETTRIVTASLGERAEALGAATLAVRRAVDLHTNFNEVEIP